MFSFNHKKSKKMIESIAIKTQTLWWLISCQLLTLLTIFSELALWMLGIIGLCLCWRALMIIQPQSTPSKGVLALLSLSGCILLALNGVQLGLMLSMVHLLCFAYALKGLELKQRKDVYQLSLLGIFVLAASLIFSQSIYFSLVVIALVVANLVLLISLHLSSKALKKPLNQLKLVGILVVQAIPLALVLFVILPKLPPLWKVPSANNAASGLSDSVKIGDIAQLALSDELAFRVEFSGDAPKYQDMYWRAIVLETFDGKSWGQTDDYSDFNNLKRRDKRFDVIEKGDIWYQYQIFAEPSYQHWLYALDVAKVDTSGVIQLPQYNLYSQNVISQVKQYNVRSNASMPLDLTISQQRYQLNVRFPKHSNPKLTQEGIRLRKLYQNDEDLIAAVLARFRQQAYFYTLRPPRLIDNSLDQFYFDTKAGFCEYYASSFAYLMRAAGIPARVVLGYMGGEYNPNLGYYSVYQSEAHAWTEVWLKGKGWQRIDPTAAVSPERVESGFSSTLLAEQASLSDSLFTAQVFENFAFLNTLRLQLAALDYQWTRWVVGYSAKDQLQVLAKLFGNAQPWKSAAVIGATIGLTMLIIWLCKYVLSKRGYTAKNKHYQLYLSAVELLKKYQCQREKSESVTQFANKVTATFSKQNPKLCQHFNQLSALFTKLEYQYLPAEQQTKLYQQLKVCVQHFKQEIRQL